MKRQIFILMLVVLVTIASANKSYGDSTPGSAPRPTDCKGDPLHPIAGNPYIYQAASTPTGSNFTFWATKDMNFITTTAAGVTTTNMALTMLKTPTDLLSTSANYALTGATDQVTITWSDAVLSGTTLASPTFVAVNADGTCTNNFKAWSITPMMAFTVDITNIDAVSKASLAYDVTTSQCFDQVRNAHWDVPTSKMMYDFGTQVLYFEVVAANFTNSWTPEFNLSGLGNGQTAVIVWDYTTAFSSPVAVTSGVLGTSPVLTSAANTSTGVSIYVRVTITNATYEGTAATPITLAVDGQNSVGAWDVVNTGCVATTGPDKNDIAVQTINPRPAVTPVAPTPFVNTNVTN